MRRRGGASVAANPVLIGAATTLIVIVAVFLAYNANNGLPFVPTYELKAEFPDAANIVKGNDVRIGGTRVGVVSEIKPKAYPNGRVTAVLTLKLQTKVKPLPVDSTLIIRPRSALGLKYVEISRGTSKKGFADGASIPLKRATPKPVEIDQVFNTFDAPTRRAAAQNLDEFGTVLAGRGYDLNTAIQAFDPLTRYLIPVARNLADPRTGLGRLFRALERTASIVAPVATTQAELFVNLDRTFAGLEPVEPQIQQSISGGPPALDAAINNFPRQRPFLANSAAFFHELRPGVAALGRSAPALADALETGTPTLRRAVALNTRLQGALRALQRFATSPLVKLGLHKLTGTVRTLRPTIAYLVPAQTTCNYITLWFRNVSSLLSEGDANGTWQRFIIIAAPSGPNNEGGPSSAPANGPTRDNHLHANSYPNTASPGQVHECEAANENYIAGQTVIGNVPGNQGTRHDVTKIDRSGTQ